MVLLGRWAAPSGAGPVFHSQSCNSTELRNVTADESQTIRHTNCGNFQVIRAYRFAMNFQPLTKFRASRILPAADARSPRSRNPRGFGSKNHRAKPTRWIFSAGPPIPMHPAQGARQRRRWTHQAIEASCPTPRRLQSCSKNIRHTSFCNTANFRGSANSTAKTCAPALSPWDKLFAASHRHR